MMTDDVQMATQRVNLRMSEEELVLLEEVRQLLDQRVKRIGVKDLPRVQRVTQRMAIVESLRYYSARLKDLERETRKGSR